MAKVTDMRGRPVQDEPLPPLIYCMGCTGWRHMGGSFGECKPSGKYLSTPIITTDLTTCTMAVAKVG